MANEILSKLQIYLGIDIDTKLVTNSICISFGDDITVDCELNGGNIRFDSIIGVAPFNDIERHDLLTNVLRKSSKSILIDDGIVYFDKEKYIVGLVCTYSLEKYNENEICRALVKFASLVQRWVDHISTEKQPTYSPKMNSMQAMFRA